MPNKSTLGQQSYYCCVSPKRQQLRVATDQARKPLLAILHCQSSWFNWVLSKYLSKQHFSRLVCLLVLTATPLFCRSAEMAQLLVRTPVLAPQVTFGDGTQAWLDSKPIVRVAFWGSSRAPLHMGFEPNVLEGITADVLGLLQQTLGVQFQVICFRDRIEALQAVARGEIDMLGLHDATENEDPGISPSVPYLLNRRVIVRRINEAFKPPPNLKGERLAYFDQGNLLKKQLARQYPDSQLIRYSSYLNALTGLTYDQADAFFTDAITAEFLISRYHQNDVYIAGDALGPNGANINFAVSEQQPHLLDAINTSLSAIPLAGMLRITNRWGLSNQFVIPRESLSLSPEQLTWIKAHPKLKVLVAGSYAPLTFFDDQDRLQGLSADLLKLIERRTGLEFEIVRSNGVHDMVSKLRSSQADLIAAVSIGDFRLNKDQYTRPYLVSPFVVVTRRSEADIRSLAELDRLRIALPSGNPLSAWMAEKYPAIVRLPAENATRGLEMVVDESAEGAVHTLFGADYFIKHHFFDDLHIASVIGPTPARIAMAVSEQNQELKAIINQVLLEIAPEELKMITDRWSNHDTPAIAYSWNTYKETVYTVSAVALLFVLIFLLWNHYLRIQIKKREIAEQALENQLEVSHTLGEQLRMATENALEANHSKSVFLASMSHEIRTPISALIGLIEMLRLQGASHPHFEEVLEVAHLSGQSLLSLIGDILDLSKIEAGAMSTAPTATHLGQLVQAVHKLFEISAHKKSLEYRLVVQINDTGVVIDALMLNQIISNLLSNAIKFTEHGSVQLLLRQLRPTEREGFGRFAIQISDTGIGLTEAQQKEIFEPFVQVGTQQKQRLGTGLGLNICSRLANLIGAQLTVDSQPGLGSNFSLIFEAQLTEVAAERPDVDERLTTSHRLKILVVEDHAPNRLLLCQQLNYLGHDTVPCDDGEAAFAHWQQADPPFDLTITDCNMPNMDGYELSRRIRQVEHRQTVRPHPIFGLTANAQSQIIEQCLEAGMNRCLFKPLSIETLSPLISHIAQQSERALIASRSNDGGELEKIRLLSPEAYGPLVDEIIRTHREDSTTLLQLMRDNNHEAILKVAHKIRGGAQLTGELSLIEACALLEDAAQKRQKTYRREIETVLAELHGLETKLLLDRPE